MVSGKITPGLKGEKETIVCEHNVASQVDSFSTPSMILLMERASVAAIDHLLGPDETSVGYEVNIRHLAPTPLGARIVAHSELTEVRKNRLIFKVEAYSGNTKIGDGTHSRAIISTDSSGR